MLKGLFAGAVALVAILAAIAFSAGYFDRPGGDIVRALALGFGPFCFVITLVAAIFAALSLIAVFAAFAIHEDPGHRRPARPFAVTVLLIALALIFAAFWCMRDPEPDLPPAPPPVAPAPPQPIVEPAPGALIEAEPAPVPGAADTGYSYPFAYPRIGAAGPVRSPQAERPLDDIFGADAAAGAALLCGKAWVAFAGAASEEGPRDRNEARARARAAIAIERARRWLARQGDGCDAPVLLGVDLGQHAPTGRENSDGALTGYQRDVMAISRVRIGDADRPDAAAALAELNAFLARPEGRSAVENGRIFLDAPAAFIP